jgi:hypothetical protein
MLRRQRAEQLELGQPRTRFIADASLQEPA